MGFPSAPVYEAHEAMDDPHLLERGMWVKASQPAVGEYRVPNFPAKFYKTPGEVVSGAPMLGQHTEEVLTTMLGYTPEQVKALEKEGKVVCWRG
jgi:crotonobetainyl-CoA:carnitine CoA-transferase CaiB-like acyl-CoA transferase